MANPEQLDKLREGAKAWNEWRATTNEPIDLRGANLFGANLNGSNLSGAELGSANLLTADLSGTNLLASDLSAADLRFANLKGADLSETNLAGTDITAAQLDGANFAGAKLFMTTIGMTDLSEVKNLETCVHIGPSILDHATLLQSGTILKSFLRGCGLPENYISSLPSFLNQPIQFYSCFISYSTQDQDFANRLHEDLQNKGVRCWFAPHDMAPGQKIHEQIDEAIRLHDKLLLILSEHSMNSEWVKTEIRKARKREVTDNRRMLFPVSLVGFKPLKEWECFDAEIGKDAAIEIREYFIPDFSTWKTNHDTYKENFDRLLNSLQAKDNIAGNV